MSSRRLWGRLLACGGFLIRLFDRERRRLKTGAQAESPPHNVQFMVLIDLFQKLLPERLGHAQIIFRTVDVRELLGRQQVRQAVA